MDNTEPIKTHCGKVCESCVHRQDLGCPGCMVREPASLSWSCEIAQCCKSKGHMRCESCQFFDSCYKRQKREHIPAEITRKRLARENAQNRLNQRAADMGRWLWIFFWLFVPRLVGSLLSSGMFVNSLSATYWIGTVMVLGCDLAYALILVRLGKVSKHYHISGWCSIGSMGIAVLLSIILLIPAFIGLVSLLSFALGLVDLVISLLGTYHYYQGHMDALSGYDNGLKEKWQKLWKWYLICFAGFIGFFVLLIIPILGVLVFLASGIGLIVLSILEMVYLYQTANFFRTYGQQTEAPETYQRYAR